MRKLAVLAFSFGIAVFGASYLLDDTACVLASLMMGLTCIPVGILWNRKRSRTLLRGLIVLIGLSLGFAWTSLYTVIFFQPARNMDDKTLVLTGQVADWPQQTEYGYSVVVRAGTDTAVRVNMILYTDEQGAELRPGDSVTAVAHCTLGDRTFAGEEITYYVAKGIFLRGQAYGTLDVDRPERIPMSCWAAVLSRELKDSISTIFPEEEGALVRALVTGNRDYLTDAFTTSLQRTGLSHTVAVSGMHLALSAGMFVMVLGRGRRSTAVLTILWSLLFCGMAGNTPSVVRAAVMIILLQVAPLFERERDSATALSVALMLLLVWNPFSAAHIGLQLSFAAVAGIFLVSDDIQEWVSVQLKLNKRPKDQLLRVLISIPRFIVATLSATLGASLFTVPLVAIHFQSVSLISPLSNVLTLWAVAVLFTGGLLLGLLGILLPQVAEILALPFTLLARYLNWVIDALGDIPFASLSLESVYYRLWTVFLCVLLCILLWGRGRIRLRFSLGAAVVTLAASICLTVLTFKSGTLTTAVLDVGQGQSVLIRAGNYLTLVDCGGDGPDNAGDVAADYIQSVGEDELDLLVISHFHSDHANGIPQLMRRVSVDAIAVPDVGEGDVLREEILALAREQDCEVWFIREDTHVSLGEEQKFMLYAPLGEHEDPNEQGLTVLASAGAFDVLLTGDMGADVERLLLERADLPDVEMMVAGHHGSAYSTGTELLARVSPETVVISVGEDNRYGHPASSTLERLRAAGADIYRTDLQGTVVIHSK